MEMGMENDGMMEFRDDMSMGEYDDQMDMGEMDPYGDQQMDEPMDMSE